MFDLHFHRNSAAKISEYQKKNKQKTKKTGSGINVVKLNIVSRFVEYKCKVTCT